MTITEKSGNYSSLSAAAVFLLFVLFSGLDCLGLILGRCFPSHIVSARAWAFLRSVLDRRRGFSSVLDLVFICYYIHFFFNNRPNPLPRNFRPKDHPVPAADPVGLLLKGNLDPAVL